MNNTQIEKIKELAFNLPKELHMVAEEIQQCCYNLEKEIQENYPPKTTSTDIEEVYERIYDLFDTGVNLDGMSYEYEKQVLEPSVKELIAPHLSNKSELKKEAVEEEK